MHTIPNSLFYIYKKVHTNKANVVRLMEELTKTKNELVIIKVDLILKEIRAKSHIKIFLTIQRSTNTTLL
jgi:hypothetical protein